jgi:hypothetical protein
MSLSFSRASIPEICQKCDHFAAFAGASAKYLGEREGNLAKKRGDERKKCDSPCHVSLCGRGNELRAQGIVVGYLANALFYLTNDNFERYLLARQLIASVHDISFCPQRI